MKSSSPCMRAECGDRKVPGNGNRYCARHKAEAAEQRRAKELADIQRWRLENPQRAAESAQAYRERHAEQERQRARDWYAANTDRAKARYRARREALGPQPRCTRYGLTIDDYDAMLEVQGGACAICRRTENGKRQFFDIDHDHATGEIRGLLCNRCNRLLSNACDDVNNLHAAIAYLERSVDEVAA